MELPWVLALLLIAMTIWHGGRAWLRPHRRVQFRRFVDDHPRAMATMLFAPILLLVVLGGLAIVALVVHGNG